MEWLRVIPKSWKQFAGKEGGKRSAPPPQVSKSFNFGASIQS